MCKRPDTQPTAPPKRDNQPTAPPNPIRRQLALLITTQCLSVSQLYLYLGGSSTGRTAFRHMAEYLLPNADDNVRAGGMILVVFGVPLWIAGMACHLLLDNNVGEGDDNAKQSEVDACEIVETASPNSETSSESSGLIPHESSFEKYQPVSFSFSIWKETFFSPRRFALVFTGLPCLVFYACNLWRHYQLFLDSYPSSSDTEAENNQTHDSDINVSFLYRQLLQHIANDSAILALIAMAYLLVPVSKHGPLLALTRWCPVDTIVIHNWAGRLGVWGTVLHGGLHLICGYWRWWNAWTNAETMNGRTMTTTSSWYGYYLPPQSCWKQSAASLFGREATKDLELGYGCYRETTPCRCYDFFLNLTGLLGMLALVILGCGSVGYVRRHYYKLFYLVHVSMAPLFAIMTLLHYNRAILYLCPGLLYYASTTVPSHVQNWMQRRTRERGTRILSVTEIASPSSQRPNAPVWDIVFECSPEAFERFRPGQHCHLHVPDVSVVAHPFTVNKVRGYDDRLRILVRETGPFTTQLGKRLGRGYQRQIDEMESQSSPPLAGMPVVNVSEFNGTSERMQQLQSHDHAIIIAGGIGITPYLTLLMDIIDHRSSALSNRLKTLELHWMCRDMSLIKYLYDEYFSEMLRCTSSYDRGTLPSVKITVHYTGTQEEDMTCDLSSRPDKAHFEPSSEYTNATHPMKLYLFSVGSKFATVAFTSIFSFDLWLVWFFYAQIQSQDDMAARMLSLFFIIVSSIALSIGLVHYGNAYKVQPKISLSSLKTGVGYSATLDNDMSHKIHVSYQQHSTGRPDLKTLLLPLKHALNPGIFVCGPREMVDNVRYVANDLNEKMHPSSVYEERFEK